MTSTGLAVGVAIFSYVIAQTIAVSGWRAAFISVGSIALVIGLANVVFLVRDDDGSASRTVSAGDVSKGLAGESSLGSAMKTSDFWLYTASFTLIIFGVVGCNFHLPALLSDRGATPGLIGTVMAVGAGGSLFGRLFTGILLDRYSVLGVASVFFVGQAIGFLLLLEGLQWTLPASFLLGAVMGAEVDIMGYVVARRFGRSAYACIFGMCFGITLFGAMTGPLVMATIFDRTGSYDLGLKLLPILPVFALILLWRVTPLPMAKLRVSQASQKV